jgi:hypothetical protein
MSLATLVGVTHITTSNTTIIKTDTVYFTDPCQEEMTESAHAFFLLFIGAYLSCQS